jgi:single-stranded-DNA-specific exonuclease
MQHNHYYLNNKPLLPLRNFTSLSSMGQQWKWRCDDNDIALDITKYLQLPEPLARVLAGRGIDAQHALDYLEPTLRNSLPNPFELRDMDKAVARIIEAVQQHQRIVIFGDYDVDGATSTALLMRYFAMIGVEVGYYIPDRMSEGYGPNSAAMDKLKAQGAELIITVDCGAVAFAPLSHAAEIGLDLVVIDHHKGAAELPKAIANVNPNRLDEHNPNTHLAAVGVCFLLLVALNKTLREDGFFANHTLPEPNLISLLDIVALGTVCDVVSLTTINRTFVKQGLKIMQTRANAGISALLEVAGIDASEALSAYHLGFVLGPRINAGGRVGESSLGVRLLTSTSNAEIAQIAKQLNQYNAERQAIEAMVLDSAMKAAEKQANYDVIMVAGQHWHEGVIGIVASRIKDKFNRPSVVISLGETKGKASARSVTGADIGAAIVSARENGVILEGGGHAMAGGFSLDPSRLDAVHQFFIEHMQASVGRYLENKSLKIDVPITCAMANHALLATLNQAAPYGMGNPSPVLVIYDALIQYIDILKEQHLRLTITDSSNMRLKAMCFRAVGTKLGDFLLQSKGKKVHLCGSLSENNWQGNSSINFMISDAMANI